MNANGFSRAGFHIARVLAGVLLVAYRIADERVHEAQTELFTMIHAETWVYPGRKEPFLATHPPYRQQRTTR
jgi:hypothetical protein